MSLIDYLKKMINPLLYIEEYSRNFTVARIDNLGFCLCLRHDMDLMNREMIDAFFKFEERAHIKSTCFFLFSQLRKYKKQILLLQEEGWDIQFHSQSRPFSFKPNPFKMESLYRSNLKKEFSRVAALGFNCSGHAPHAIHCFVGYDPDLDWSVIEKATAGSGFKWICGYRLPVKTEYGEEFPTPLPSYNITAGGSGNFIIVYQTSWDDRFFFISFRGKLLGNAKRTVEEAKKNILRQINFCKETNMPFIISLHPFQFLKKDPAYPAELIQWLVSYCSQWQIPIKTIEEVLNEHRENKIHFKK